MLSPDIKIKSASCPKAQVSHTYSAANWPSTLLLFMNLTLTLSQKFHSVFPSISQKVGDQVHYPAAYPLERFLFTVIFHFLSFKATCKRGSLRCGAIQPVLAYRANSSVTHAWHLPSSISWSWATSLVSKPWADRGAGTISAVAHWAPELVPPELTGSGHGCSTASSHVLIIVSESEKIQPMMGCSGYRVTYQSRGKCSSLPGQAAHNIWCVKGACVWFRSHDFFEKSGIYVQQFMVSHQRYLFPH